MNAHDRSTVFEIRQPKRRIYSVIKYYINFFCKSILLVIDQHKTFVVKLLSEVHEASTCFVFDMMQHFLNWKKVTLKLWSDSRYIEKIERNRKQICYSNTNSRGSWNPAASCCCCECKCKWVWEWAWYASDNRICNIFNQKNWVQKWKTNSKLFFFMKWASSLLFP